MASPIRRCLGCGQSRPKAELVRWVLEGNVPRIDLAKRAPGRGAYLCGEGCLLAAFKRKAFSRAFRGRMQPLELVDLQQVWRQGTL